MVVDLRGPPLLHQRLIYVYESDFKIQNFQSAAIAHVDLCLPQNPRLNSLFASSLKKFDWSPFLFTFIFAGTGPAPIVAWSLALSANFTWRILNFSRFSMPSESSECKKRYEFFHFFASILFLFLCFSLLLSLFDQKPQQTKNIPLNWSQL